MKGGKYAKTLAKIQARGIFRIRDIWRNVLPKFIGEPYSWSNLPIPENLVITWPYTERTTVRPHHRHTNVYSHFLASLGAQEKTDCTSMQWSTDSCQHRVSADQYHLTVSRAQVSTHRGRVFLGVIRWQVTSFQMIAGSSLCFKNLDEICLVYVIMAQHY